MLASRGYGEGGGCLPNTGSVSGLSGLCLKPIAFGLRSLRDLDLRNQLSERVDDDLPPRPVIARP